MIKINKEKNWNQATDEEKVSYCEELLNESKGARLNRDWEWYMNHQFREGNHYAQYNTVTNTLERPPRTRGEVRLVVNKIASSIRSIQNYAVRFDPKWVCVPGDLDPETVKNSHRSGKLLDYLHRHLHWEASVRGIVGTGLDTSIGVVELGWDDKADDGLGQVLLRMHDPFDIWFDPRAFLYANKLIARYVCKATQKAVDEVSQDEKYNKKNRVDVSPDEDLAASPMKARIIRKEQTWMEQEKTKRVTVKEFSLWDDEENGEGGNITLFTYAGGKALREEELDLKEYDLYVFQIPQDPLKIYHRSWIADAIPLNKALDRNLSQEVMYVNQALIYRILAEKGHGIDFSTFNNEMGEVVEFAPGRTVKQWEMQAWPSTGHNLSAELSNFIEDTLSAHEATTGGMPVGARSGNMIEALQAAEANSLAGIRMSLESFLSVIGKRALEIIAEKYQTSRIIRISEPEIGSDGKPISLLRVIGKGAKNKPKEAAVISGDDEVIVQISSRLGYTPEAQRTTLMDLSDRGIIPREEVLRYYEFPNIDDIAAKAREQALEKQEMEAEIAGRRGTTGGQPQPTTPTPQGGTDMIALADQENTAIANGQDLPPTQEATPEHTQAHVDFVQSPIFGQLPGDRQQSLITHYQGEIAQGG